MVTASELRTGMALRIDHEIYRAVEVEARPAAAKMGGTVRAKLRNVRSGRTWDQHFRPLEKLEDLQLDKQRMEFLFEDGTTCTFLRLDTYEQVEYPEAELGLAAKLMAAGSEVDAEFFESELIRVEVPETVESRVKTTAPAMRAGADSARKEATLENGMTIQVPLFVDVGETVSVDSRTGRYVERVRTEHKKGT